jgi:hypothetical protein
MADRHPVGFLHARPDSGYWCLVSGVWEHCLRYAFAYHPHMRLLCVHLHFLALAHLRFHCAHHHRQAASTVHSQTPQPSSAFP